MLESLRVKNVALIDEAEMEFKEGLNILTGETGAGKSILIGSINLALGAKADKSMIRTGAEYAFVELVFSVTEEEQLKKLKELDVYVEDGTLVLQRRILPSKNVCKANGETITNRALKEIGEILMDIHGQHEHQSLLKEKKQAEILDEFCPASLKEIKEQISRVYLAYTKEKEELNGLEDKGENKEKEISLLQFEAEEIEQAALTLGEDCELEAAYEKMANSRRIAESIELSHNLLNGTMEGNVISLFGRAMGEINSISEYDRELKEILEDMVNGEDLLTSISRRLEDYGRTLSFDENEFREISSRLNTINHLKSKYGDSIEGILAYQKEIEKQLLMLTDLEKYKEELFKKHEQTEKELLKLCGQASAIRQEQAAVLEGKMKEALVDLNFLDVQFQIAFEKKQPCRDGYDKISFLIALNPGEPSRPLEAVASGGELSRIMLALKTVLANKDRIGTLIFDEIDTGISGKTAWKVSEKLGMLGRDHQVLCITHLPQIAAMADCHFLIEKNREETKAVTRIRPLSREDMLKELARLLGTDNITEAGLKNAMELKKMAEQTKQY
ncbi:MAG: DNA repair protein RecN [Roseburia sp.]|nr:DNA repair protein RecN [Roseburia sp.]MCM1278468.1 DNA repair protein RecN [Robinsoniella sp.]